MMPTKTKLKTEKEIDAYVIRRYVPLHIYHMLLEELEYNSFVEVKE